MEGDHVTDHRLDRIARQLAQRRFSRRGALRVGTLSLTAVLLKRNRAAAQSTPTACSISSENEVEVGGGWLCNQTYALCTTAACEPPDGDSTTVSCPCVVLDGYSFGMKTCSERAPVGENLISTFSTQNVNSGFMAMACPADAPWANCLDYPCQLDPQNPALATCQCELLETGPSLIFGGRCNPESCTSTIWSGAAPPGVLAQYTTAMECVDQQVASLTVCPGTTSTPAASPTA